MGKNLTCVILAAGLGTRLKPILQDTPKPMAMVNGKPFLEYLIAQLKKERIDDIVLCIAYKAEVIEGYFSDGKKFGVHIRYAKGDKPAGTAGELLRAKPYIQSNPFIVMNGDSYCEVDFRALFAYHRNYKAQITVAATKVKDTSRSGSITIAEDGSITNFVEKEPTKKSGYINGGIYLFNQSALDEIQRQQYRSLEQEAFPAFIRRGLYAFKTSGLFIDIGTPADFQRAQELFKNFKFPQ